MFQRGPGMFQSGREWRIARIDPADAAWLSRPLRPRRPHESLETQPERFAPFYAVGVETANSHRAAPDR